MDIYMELINCRQIAQGIEDKIAKQVYALCADPNSGYPMLRRPSLAIIKVGEKADSALYVKIKERQAKSVGIETSLYLLSDNTTNEEVLTAIKFLNDDPLVDGILVQLPLPAHLDTDRIIASIKPSKDVDGFHAENLTLLASSEETKIIPPVYAGIIACLANIKFELAGKSVVIIGKSDIFTSHLDSFLQSLGASVQVFKATDTWQAAAKKAELLISAVGKPQLINKDCVSAGVVIIDIGISQIDGKTYGDADAQSLKDIPGHLTPVPGGMGPLTVALALQDTFNSYLGNIKTNE